MRKGPRTARDEEGLTRRKGEAAETRSQKRGAVLAGMREASRPAARTAGVVGQEIG